MVSKINWLAPFSCLLAAGLGVGASAEPSQHPQASLRSPASILAFPSTFGVPTAVAPRAGTAFVGATYANPRGGVRGAGGDGDIVAGYSIGNPIEAVSLTFAVALTGIEPLGDAGSFSISASRLLRAAGNSATYAGLSVSNIAPWGVNKARPAMYSAYMSHLVGLSVGDTEIPLQLTVGVGTDNTRKRDGSGVLQDGAFVGLGVGVTEAISASLSATRTQLNIGASISLKGSPISATIGVLDVTNNTDRRQVSVSVGISF
jgi:hypothetical protein